MWNPFKKKPTPNRDFGSIIRDSKCAIVLYYDNDGACIDFKFDGKNVIDFVQLFCALNAGILFDEMMEKILTVIQSQGAKQDQVEAFIKAVQSTMEALEESDDEQDENAPLVKPLDVFGQRNNEDDE